MTTLSPTPARAGRPAGPGIPARPARRRGLLIGGLVAAAAFVALVLAVLAGDGRPLVVQRIDDAWRAAVGAAPGAETAPLSLFFQTLGAPLSITIGSSVVPLLFLVLGRWRTAIYAFAVMAFNGAVMNYALKLAVGRPRPAEDAEAGLHGPLLGHFAEVSLDSFPSGHTAFAASLAVIAVAATRGKTRVAVAAAGILVVAGMIWQRTMVNAHWLSDTVGGALGVLGAGLLLWWALAPWLAREGGLPVMRWGRAAGRREVAVSSRSDVRSTRGR